MTKMFETGMSALVLKICSEYAKSLGLNFPPCTQQEINAICEWVDKHTIKDMTISQNGYNVTFTFKTENDTTKEFTFTIPKKVDVDELEKVLKGSDSIVVDRLVDNSGLQVRISQSVLNDINSKLTKPANPAADSAVTMLADGTVGTKPLSEIGGGGKLYRHNLLISFNEYSFDLYTVIYSAINVAFGYDNLLENLSNHTTCVYDGSSGGGVVDLIKIQNNKLSVKGVIASNDNTVTVTSTGAVVSSGISINDTVTEL